jgi:uncharacterized protein YcfJ
MRKEQLRRYESPTQACVAGALLATFVALAAGCENAGQGAVSGGAIGALGGLAIGSLTGNAGAGAAIGAISGAVAGGVIGDQNQRAAQQQRDMRYGGQ